MNKTVKLLEYAMFSQPEMERRYKSARQFMSQQGIDALMISGEDNFQYFAGTSSSLALHASLTRPSIFILPINREPIIVTQRRRHLTLGSYVTDIRDYFEVLSFPHDILLDALKEITSNQGRIGVELGHETRMGIPVGAYLDLVTALSGVQFVDASNILAKLRMVKSQEELAYIRRAVDVTGRARQRLFDLVRPGMTERDVTRLMRQLILEEGGDNTSFVILQLDLPGAANQFNYDRPLEKGTVLAIDTGATVGMYTTDYARMAVLGPATGRQKDLHRKVLEINQKMMNALRPGVKCSEIYRICVKAIEDFDLEILGPPAGRLDRRMGHGQGLLITEPPSIAAKDETMLEQGMVICTEPGIRLGDLHFLWEDVHVITENGYEQLTNETEKLREIPF